MAPLRVDAHASLICTSTSVTIPDRVMLWISTYDHTNINTAAGNVIITTSTGQVFRFPFNVFCAASQPLDGITQVSTTTFEDTIKRDCAGLTVQGRPAVDTNTHAMCYKKEPNTPLGPNLGRIGVPERDRSKFGPPAWLDGGYSYRNWLLYMFAVAIDNVIPGWFEIFTEGTDQALLPHWDASHPTNLGYDQDAKWMYQLSSTSSVAFCSTPPPSSLLTNTDADQAYLDEQCTNVPLGTICYANCNAGFTQVGVLVCVLEEGASVGSWSESFKCTSGDFCQVPDSSNAPIFALDPVRPNGVFSNVPATPSCGVVSEIGAACDFSCDSEGYWGVSFVVCTPGGFWAGYDPSTECQSPDADKLPPAPVITSMELEGDSSFRVIWEDTNDGLTRSKTFLYEFNVLPAGSLTCPQMNGRQPPTTGLLCTGGDPANMQSYQVQVRAENNQGPGPWSDFVTGGCVGGPQVSSALYAHSCPVIAPIGAICQVHCAAGLLGNRADLVCSAGSPSLYKGVLPVCLRQANAPVVISIQPLSTTELAIQWENQGLGSIGEEADPDGYDCQTNVNCIGERFCFERKCPLNDIESTALCAEQCDLQEGCTVFVYKAVAQECYLKDNTTATESTPPAQKFTCCLEDLTAGTNLLGRVNFPAEVTIGQRGLDKCLDVGAGYGAGSPVANTLCNGDLDQQQFEMWSDGTIRMRSQTSICFEGVAGLVQAGNSIQLVSPCTTPSSASKFEWLSDDTIHVKDEPSLCLNMGQYGATLQMTACSGLAAEEFFTVTTVKYFRSNPFAEWAVEIRTGGGDWFVPNGCADQQETCSTKCTAIDLDPSTTYEVQVRAVCHTSPYISSPYSAQVNGVTNPIPAGLPTGLGVSNIQPTSADIAWTAGSVGNCTFVSWRVELQGTSALFVESPSGCQDLNDRSSPSCSLTNLPCNTNFAVRVTETCSNPLANSPVSTISTFSTPKDGDCVLPISAPSIHTFMRSSDELSMHSFYINWTVPAYSSGEPGYQAHDCTFSSFQLRMQHSLGGGEWREVHGCTNLLQWSVRQCVGQAFLATQGAQATRWQIGDYRVYLYIACQDSRSNSPISTVAGPVSPLPYKANAPYLTFNGVGDTYLTLNWIIPEFEDCTFTAYTISLRDITGGGSFQADPPGCTNLVTPCKSSCQLYSLVSNTRYTAEIQTRCLDPQADSDMGGLYPGTVTTEPQVQSPPLTATVPAASLTAVQGTLTWTTGSQSKDCTFQTWDVEFQQDGQSTWAVAAGCSSLNNYNTRSCTFTSLSCDTTYRGRIRQVCQLPGASSTYTFTAPFTMLKSGTCLKAASPPGFVTLGSPTTQTLSLTWLAGVPEDCVFAGFEVQVRPQTEAVWQEVYAGTCKGKIVPRGGVSCTLPGLFPDTAYLAQVRETCDDPALNSGWSVTVEVGRTSAVPEIVISTFLPSGAITETRPTSLTGIFDTGVELNFGAIEPDTYGWAEKCADEGGQCDCNGNIYFGKYRAQGSFHENSFMEMQVAGGYFNTSVSGIVGCRPDCSSGPPPGLCVGGSVDPLVSWACWCEAGTQAPTPRQVSICPQSDDPLPNSCGCTGVSCTSSCVTPPASSSLGRGVHLLNPQILWYTFGSALEPGSGCQYIVTIDEGYLKTQLSPPRRSPAITWQFKYDPQPPQLAMTLTQVTATSFTLSAAWDMPTNFTCSIEGVAGSSASATYIGSGFVEIVLGGMTPSLSWEVACSGHELGDEWNVASATAGPFTTDGDPNAFLSSIEVTIWNSCAETSPRSHPQTKTIMPALQPTDAGGFYEARIDVSGFRDDCGYTDAVDVEVAFVAVIQVVPQSPFATVTYNPASRETSVPKDSFINWRAGQLPTDGPWAANLSVTVQPFTGGPTRANTFTVQVTALFANLQFVAIRAPTWLKDNDFSRVEVDITCELGVDTSSISLRFGDHHQTTVAGPPSIVMVGGRQQQSLTLRVENTVGYGNLLPVVLIGGGVDYATPASVSFEEVVILGSNGLPVCEVPRPGNDGGVTGPGGTPNTVIPSNHSGPCNIPYSETLADCQFLCTSPGSWGYGRLRCTSGDWGQVGSTAACYLPADDSIWHAPVLTALDDEGGGVMRVRFTWESDGSIRSDPTYFAFNVVPSNTLMCPNSPGPTAPADGALCTGGESFNMGQYKIKAKVVNLAGSSSWSNEMQRACPPITSITHGDRYNTTGCSGLIDGEVCQVTCSPQTVQVDGLPLFRCVPPVEPQTVPAGQLPKCYKPALQPVNLAVTSSSDQSLTITWSDGGLNDCGNLVPFIRWKVQLRVGTGAWVEPQGCRSADNPCNTVCQATNLLSNTAYTTRVSAECDRVQVSSPFSSTAVGSTWPAVSQPPQNLQTTGSDTTTLDISWNTNANEGDCVFQKWKVEVQGPSGTWRSNPDGCDTLTTKSATNCQLIGLQCDTTYNFRVAYGCTDPRADSVFSSPTSGTTIKDGSCLNPAGKPTALAGDPQGSPTSMVLTWTAGAANDCQFLSWKVLIRRTYDGVESGWVVYPGCDSPGTREPAGCTATGLVRGTYNFYVVEECVNPQTNSQDSEISPDIIPPLTPAEAPANVGTSAARVNGFRIFWDGRDLNDCSFTRFEVGVQEVGSNSWASVAGCDALISPCVTECEAVGLVSNRHYEVRARVLCQEPTAVSQFSAVSPSILTLPTPAAAPTSLAASSPTTSTVLLTWAAAPQSVDCAFVNWEVRVQAQTFTSWSTPSGCDDLSSRAVTQCTARGLICNTGYQAQVREVCALSGATSEYTPGASFATLKEGTCLKGATSPSILRLRYPTTTTLSLSFVAGTANDCVFQGFELQIREVGASLWVPAGANCAAISVREGPSCTAENLLDGVSYHFRARELCSNSVEGSLDSPWGTSEEPGTTIAVPPVTVVARAPEGTQVESRPNSLLVVYGVNVVLHDAAIAGTARISICPQTSLEVENSCGCVASTCSSHCVYPAPTADGGNDIHVQFLNAQVMMYRFGDGFAPGSHCTYSIDMDPGFVRTEMVPAKLSRNYSWTFVFVPTPPALQMSLVTSTITSLQLSLTWSLPAQFNCSNSSDPNSPYASWASGEYSGSRASQITLVGLVPSQAYNIHCAGTSIQDRWNTAQELRGPFRTADDTNNFFSSLVVRIRWRCGSDPSTAGPEFQQSMLPAFDATVKGTSHEVLIDGSNFRTDCAVAAGQDATVRFDVTLDGAAQSPFGEVQYFPASTAELTLEWLRDTEMPSGRIEQDMAAAVWPHTGRSANENRVTVRAALVFLDLRIESFTAPSELQGGSSVDMTITLESGIDPTFTIHFGAYVQITTVVSQTVVTVSSRQRQRVVLQVPSSMGFGTDLDVVVVASGMVFSTAFTVSFAEAPILGRNGLPVCEVPGATNGAGIAGLAGHPHSVVSTTDELQPFCGTPYSESGSNCYFQCSGGWGYGKLVCGAAGAGIWSKQTAETDCKLDSEDSVWHAPVLTALDDMGSGVMKVVFTWTGNPAMVRSAPTYFAFDVLPTGTLVCPSYIGDTAPSVADGALCTGGTAGNMGQYIIRVQVVNFKGGSPWSNAMQRKCPALQVVGEDQSRYEVDACANLLDQQVCEVTCSAETVQVGALPLFTCIPPDEPTGTLPRCYKPALPPVNVAVSGISDASLTISWMDGGLNDCGSRVLFFRWKVEVRVAGTTQWFEPQGCRPSGTCETTCDAGGLESNTEYNARVAAECGEPEVSSPYSAAGTGTTWPTVSLPPENLQVVTQGTVTLEVSWSAPSDQGDCVFQEWRMELQSPSGTWSSSPEGCMNLRDFSVTTCTLVGLICESDYHFRMSMGCADPRADSVASASTPGSTIRDGDCLIPAGTPTGLTGTPLDPSTVDLAWVAGSSNDCDFTSWTVQIRRTYNALVEAFTSNPGCENLLSRQDTACTATGLVRGTYHFYVVEVCQNPGANSDRSELSPDIIPPLRPAEPPANLVTSDAEVHGFRILWDARALNDCTFKSWLLQVREVDSEGSNWTAPLGCVTLISPCVTECTTSGLTSNRRYVARVAAQCDEPTAVSPFSEVAPEIRTLPQQAAEPASLTASGATSTTVLISWVAPTPSPDCIFAGWEVGTLVSTFTQYSTPIGCDTLFNRAVTSCTATGLTCDTAYSVRIREVCTLPGATSDYAQGADFTTLRLGTCLKGAAAPQSVRMSEATTTSLLLDFVAGAPGDCIFDRFVVERQEEGSQEWVPAGGACDEIAAREGPSCTARGLLDGTTYNFRVRELCTNGVALNSPWAQSQTPRQTIAVPPVTVVAKVPNPGITRETRPNSVLVVFGGNVEMAAEAIASGIRFRICPQTELEVANSCGCTRSTCSSACIEPPTEPTTGVDHIYMLNPQVLWYNFVNVLTPGSGCNYTVSIEQGFIRTEMTPHKISPLIEWSFRYEPVPPQLELALLESTTTTLKMSAVWSEPVLFRCQICCNETGGPVSLAESRYTGDAPAEFTLRGLRPSTAYTVQCAGTTISDEWNSASYSRGVFRTADDTNNFFQSMVVAMQRRCSSSDDTSEEFIPALVPPFDPSKRNTNHTIRVDVSSFRKDCNYPDSVDATIRYDVFIRSTAQSPFAEVHPATDVNNRTLLLFWPRDTTRPAGRVDVNMTTAVFPDFGGSAFKNQLNIRIIAMFANLQIVGLTQSEDPLPVDGSGSLTVTLTTELGIRLDSISIKVGTFLQEVLAPSAETFLDADGSTRQRAVFEVPEVVGIGFELPVVAVLQDLEYQSNFNVSFRRPVISTISSLMVGGNFGTLASLTQDSEIILRGDELAIPQSRTASTGGRGWADIYIVGLDKDCLDLACHQASVRQKIEAGEGNLCPFTDPQYSNTAGVKPQLMCLLLPSVSNPIAIAVVVRQGAANEPVLGALADPVQGNQRLEYLKPKPTALSQPVQNITGDDPFTLIGQGFPMDNITQGFVQFWATSESEPPEDLNNPGPNFEPLCVSVRYNSAEELECVRRPDWNAGVLRSTRPRIFVQVGPNMVSDESLSDTLAIPQMAVAQTNRSSVWEIGPITLTFEGQNFGKDANGNLNITILSEGNATISNQERRRLLEQGDYRRLDENRSAATVPCTTTFRSPTQVQCTIEGSIFGGPLDPAEYQREFDDPDTVFEYPVETTVSFAGIYSGLAIPPSAEMLGTSVVFNVQLFRCDHGEHRVNATVNECLPCPPGSHKNFSGTATFCPPCEVGSYADLEKMVDCRKCAVGFTTNSTGAVLQTECICAPGYFKDVRDPSPGPHGTGLCLPCPEYAICEGGEVEPYSQAGYWSLDQRVFWECYPQAACLQGDETSTNRCAEGRKAEGRRCVPCENGYYRYRSECYICQTYDRIIAWIAPLALVLVILFCAVPKSVRAYHRERTVPDPKRTKARKQAPSSRRRPSKDAHWIFRMMPAEKWPMGLKKLAAPGRPVRRLVVLCFNRLQLIWALGLLPAEWPSVFHDQHMFLSIFAFDVDILRPECLRDPTSGFKDFVDVSYLTKFLTQWASPYIIFVLITGGIGFSCWRHPDPKDRRYIHFQSAVIATISAQALFELMSHIVDDLYFVQCMQCEGSGFCMVDNPLLKCDINQLGSFSKVDKGWFTIAFISVLDLTFITIPLVCAIILAIYKSWCWQHGTGSGVNPAGNMPWFMALSEFWVYHYKGYNLALRKEANILRDLMRDPICQHANPRDVWDHCVHTTNYERWKLMGANLQHRVDAVVEFIHIQRKHNSKYFQRQYRREKTNKGKGSGSDSDGNGRSRRYLLQAARENLKHPRRGVLQLLRGRNGNLSKEEREQDEREKRQRALMQVKEARHDRAQDQRRKYTLDLQEHLRKAQIFIAEVEGGVNIFESGTLFYTYSWEVALLAQKIFVIVIAMSSPPDAGSVVLAGAFFFMLVVLIVAVAMEPHQWQFLNTMELVMDVLTLYLIIFAQLGWETPTLLIAIFVNVVTIMPVVIRWVLPTFPEKPMEKKPLLGHEDDEENGDTEADEVAREAGANLRKSLLSDELDMVKHADVEMAVWTARFHDKDDKLTLVQRLMRAKLKQMRDERRAREEDEGEEVSEDDIDLEPAEAELSRSLPVQGFAV